MTPIDVALLLLSLGLAVPTSVVSSECLLEALGREKPVPKPPADVRVTLLVPAHDEERGIGPNLARLKQQLGPRDRILVVADNCTDRTAEVARAAGPEVDVIERFDPERRGKGFALTFGFEHLKQNPPDIVIIVDADCELNPGSIRSLAETAAATGAPIQADYTMTVPADADLKARVSAFAFRVRNRVRPRGLAVLGLPCHLAGSGMAFPFDVLGDAMPLGNDLAEDLLMGVNLALKGHFPRLLPTARVESELAATRTGQTVQRQRWEQGHLATLKHTWPRLIGAGLKRKDFRLFSIAADVGVPPLTLHVLLLGALGAASGAALAFGGGVVPLVLTAAQGGVLVLALGSAWARHGRDILPARRLIGIPLYVAWKLPLYVHMLFFGGAKSWVRTDRGPASPPNGGRT